MLICKHQQNIPTVTNGSDCNGWRRINYTIRISNISPLFLDEKSKKRLSIIAKPEKKILFQTLK